MQSQTGKRAVHVRRIESVDYHAQSPTDEGGGALQRLLTSVLAGVLTLVFAWRILLDYEETDGVAAESTNDAGNATKSTAGGRDAITSLCCTVSASIDQPTAAGTDPVTHNNAAARRVYPPTTSQLGAAGRFSLPGNWTVSSSPAERCKFMIASPSDMPSRNCVIGEGNGACSEQVLLSDELSVGSLEWTDKFPPVIRHSGGSTNRQATLDDVRSAATAMNGEERHEREVRSFQRRPLTWTSSAGSDEECGSSCGSDELNFFHALMTQDEGDSNDDDTEEDRRFACRDEEDEETPEVTSSTWISLFRTYFMGGAGHLQRSAAARPTLEPVSRRPHDRDIDDLLDRTLSTITEEGADELARKMSEIDDDLADAELTALQHEFQDEIDSNWNDMTNCSDDDEENNVNCDVNTRCFDEDAVR